MLWYDAKGRLRSGCVGWTVTLDTDARDAALKVCRGTYQRALILGTENLSSSTLKGKARRYGGRYARSRAALLARLPCAHCEARGPKGQRYLVLGELPADLPVRAPTESREA